jgi:hypothetical protein
MKRKILVLFALVAVVAVMTAAPVSADAQKPINGTMELTLFGEPCPVPHEPPFLTWAGTVVIDGTTYGWADFPTGPLVEEGKFIYFQEYWTIFALGEGEAVTPEVACDAGRVVLEGVNDGWGPPGMTGKADGTVTGADPDGPFAEVDPGSRMMWRGKITSPGEFKATLHIFPLH